MFYARAWIFTEKNATSKIIKKSPKNQFPPGGAVFALAPPSPKPTPPKGHFWRYLRCFMHIEQSSKMTVFLAPGRGSAAAARPPIAKAKAKPHAMRSNMPGIRCLVHRRIEGLPPMPPTPESQLMQGHLCQPDAQENGRCKRRYWYNLQVLSCWVEERLVDGAVDGAAMAASVAAPASVRHGAETAKPQQDSSPTCPKTSPRKTT